MFTIYGFAPGDVVPSTELVLAHAHPDDREDAAAVLKAALVDLTDSHRHAAAAEADEARQGAQAREAADGRDRGDPRKSGRPRPRVERILGPQRTRG